MNAGRRARLGARPRPVVMVVIAGLLAAAALTPSTTGSAAALTGPSPGTYVGRGFDACTAPRSDVMAAWLASSPYRAVGIYIGGNNRACAQPQLTANWVSTQRTAGWHLVPIYLGQQPYCTTSNKINRFTAANAATYGRSDAGDAVVQARALGLASGSTIFNDIEAYSTTDSVCRTAVLTYQSVWTARLHDYGFLSGFYSSLGSGVRDQVGVYGSIAYVRPDYLWFARYDGVASVLDTSTPQIVPDSYWVHRRIKQYRGGAAETYGGKTLNVDRDQLDLTPVPPTPFGDFTGNGWSDLIARRTTTGNLYLYPGNGTKFGSRSGIGTGWNGMSAITRLGDFNRDGHEDVIARESATGSLWLYRGTGSGFAPRLRISRSGWNAVREITPVGDLNRDGFPDLLAVQISTGKLYLFPGRGTSLAPSRLIGGAGWNTLSELSGVGDFNRDGRVDLVARQNATGRLWLYPGRTGAFAARISLGLGWNSVRDLVGVGDFDRDGFSDVLAVKTATGELFRYPGRGTTFGPALRIGTGWTGLQPLL
ncbi:MAG: DUF1906 domain-containing protein [Actinobacteria bacterium]|nr:DUF1906 domain-containing protein [Actinomycetota bacterium]